MIPPDDPRLIPRQHRSHLHLRNQKGKRRYKNGRYNKRQIFAFLLILLLASLLLAFYYNLRAAG